ncbi:MAG: molybdenum cofactor biosynthesis protein B [Gammaproteobacteria bacterium]|nr:molybdenum cofactor biosynthesis protein B [Gammaproteobacteria bacterium]
MSSEKNNEFKAINISVLTISDSRGIEQDDSGEYLVSALKEQGHFLNDRKICKDNLYEIRAIISQWILDENVQGIITTGGTGITGKDGTPEAILPLLDKTIDGFGEMFRSLSYQNIKTSTLQSRAFAGVANGTFIFCLPGSPGACKDGWNFLIKDQLDSRTKPCNLVELMPRLNEE